MARDFLPTAMPDEAIIEELQRKLDEADWLCDEDRAKLTRMLGQFREVCAKMEASPAISPEQAAQGRLELRGSWLNFLETCRKLEVAKGELLEKRADYADAVREAAMATLRLVHAMRKALDEGTFTGTWEERESILEIIEEAEEARESLLEGLTAEDIRQLEDEGVL